MQQFLDLDPVALRYAAALRGLVPPAPETAFRYVRTGMVDVTAALCLAASNPEGMFQFVMPDALRAMTAQGRAQAMRLKNCSFVAPEDAATKEQTDFFCADLGALHDPALLQSAQETAKQRVAPGGLFVCRYAPFPAHSDGMHFMATEFGPEIPTEQRDEFLHELKQLGQLYLETHPAAAEALDAALGQKKPEAFLQDYGRGQAEAAAIGMMAAMAPAQFSFLGDAKVQANYLEMMVPVAAQDVLYALRSHLLYEVIKDFATNRTSRTDIWVKQSTDLSGDLAQLFGYFYFGLTAGGQTLPSQVTANGQALDLTPPLFAKLLELMQLMPLTIGDFLSHPDCRAFAPQDVVMAVHMMVAFGVAAPMRGSFGGMGQADYHYPRLAGTYNQQLQIEALHSEQVMLASAVAGRPLQLSLAEALVLQAVGRVGLAESADALMPELQRVAGDPAIAAKLFQPGMLPGEDFAERMIREVCGNHMLNWYALGILDAA